MIKIQTNVQKFLLCFAYCIVLCVAFVTDAKAINQGKTDKAQGWLWYDNPAIPQPKKAPKHSASLSKDPLVRLHAFQKRIARARARAILDPTVANIRQYVRLQNFIVTKASRFSQMWKLTLLDHPKLDYSIAHPTESMGLKISHEMTHEAEDRAIQKLSKKYGLFFFYSGQDRLTKAMAPMLEAFVKTHHISFIPVSMDHTKLASFSHTVWDEGQAEHLKIHYFPALILVNPKTHEVQPLNYGFISGDELKSRFLSVAEHFRGDS